MNIEVTMKNSCVVLVPFGDLDSNTAGEFSEILKKQIETDVKTIIVDFSKVDLLASAGIGALAENYNYFKEKGGEIKLAAFSDSIAKVLSLLGFNKFFATYPSVDEALKSVKG